MNLEMFFADKVEVNETQEVIVSKRFVNKEKKPIPFVIQSITEKENQEIRKSCQVRYKQKYGQTTTETNQDLYQTRLVIACTKFPQFKSTELLESWKGKGVTSPEELVGVMLRPGEFTELLLHIQKFNGFEEEDINEVKETVKKQ